MAEMCPSIVHKYSEYVHIFVIEKGLVGTTNPFSNTNILDRFTNYESEEGHVDASLENQTLENCFQAELILKVFKKLLLTFVPQFRIFS